MLTFGDTPQQAQEFFAQLFCKHASSHLARMLSSPPPDTPSLIQAIFDRDAFAELVLAAHGIPRDAINIAALAAQHAHDQPIGVDQVRRAARDWYLRDKQAALTTNQAARDLLRRIIDEAVGRRRTRSFLLDQETTTHRDTIDELYDARLLHVQRRGIQTPHRPGTLYDCFAIDYGCYATLLADRNPHVRLRDPANWLNNAQGQPPDSFNPAKRAIDLSKLENM